jgi:phospholipid/cholesterol/gamma-HCH transport system substrate-binding protein
MNNHTTEVLVGGAVLAVAVAFMVYASQMTGVGARETDAAVYTASFTSVEGVSVGTDVRMGGVKVGTVTDLVLNPQTFRAETTFTVDQGLRCPRTRPR